MASLACQRPGDHCIGSGLARLRHKPLDSVGSAASAVLEPPECPSPRLRSCCAVNDRNGVLLGNVSGRRRFTTSAHEGGASVCVFKETAQELQKSEAVPRNHRNSSAAQRPEAINRTQAGVGEISSLHVDSHAMPDDDTPSTAFLLLTSNSDEDKLSNDTSFEAALDAIPASHHVEGALDCLTALCEALPVKRGLSRYFAGKSQSFSCLADVRSVADLAKPLNPFLKRRNTGSYLGKDACYRPTKLPASSILKRPVNSHLKAHHVLTLPKSVREEIIHAIATDYLSNSITLKCFSSQELGEARL